MGCFPERSLRPQQKNLDAFMSRSVRAMMMTSDDAASDAGDESGKSSRRLMRMKRNDVSKFIRFHNEVFDYAWV